MLCVVITVLYVVITGKVDLPAFSPTQKVGFGINIVQSIFMPGLACAGAGCAFLGPPPVIFLWPAWAGLPGRFRVFFAGRAPRNFVLVAGPVRPRAKNVWLGLGLGPTFFVSAEPPCNKCSQKRRIIRNPAKSLRPNGSCTFEYYVQGSMCQRPTPK
jgi:hypothetical protein